MRNSICVATVVMAMGAAPLFAQQRPAATTQEKTTMKKGSDTHFMTEIAHAGMAEVELGKLATDKAANPDVKKFGQRMVDDHSKANDELKTLAQNKQVMLPTTLDTAHQAALDKLSKLSGDAFDRSYMQEMVSGHRKVASMLRMESKSGADPDVKAWAAKTLPTVEDHLKMAQDLSKKPVGTAGRK